MIIVDLRCHLELANGPTGRAKKCVDTKCDALCLTHSKPESVASIGCPGASWSGNVPVSLTWKKLTRDKTVKCQTGTCRVRPDSSIYTALKPLTTTYSYRKLSAHKFINHSANRRMNIRKDPIAECMCMGRHVWTSEINYALMHIQAQQSSRVGVHEEGTCK